ncbi:hypothetical protein P3L10_027083 [Capsicum annuum]
MIHIPSSSLLVMLVIFFGGAKRKKWDLQDLRVSKLDVKKSKFGTLRKTEFIFMVADRSISVKKLSLS